MTPGLARRGARLRAGAIALALGALGVAAACGPQGPRPVRMWTESYEFRISFDPLPPRAREATLVKVVVLDRDTRQLIQNGEGRIFATSPDSANTWDSFVPGPEPGSYNARLYFVHAGDWRVSLQFRRDSTARLEKPADDLVQGVRAARPLSERALPSATP